MSGKIAAKGYAALNATSPLGPIDFHRRTVGSKDVLIEIAYCGICHSDIHQAKNEWGGSQYPMIPGHEIAGVVTEVGSEVVRYKVGDRVGVGCMVDSCRKCNSCQEGYQQYCENGMTPTYNGYDKSGELTQGGYSNRIVVNENYVLRIPDSIPLENAAPMLCAGITTYSPINHWKMGPGHRVAIVGLGGLGHMAVQIAAAKGAHVTVISHSPKKEKEAKELGASTFLLRTDHEAIKSASATFDFMIDTVSSTHNLTENVELLKREGTLVLLGVPERDPEIPTRLLIFGRRQIAGSLIGGIPETQEMLDFCASKKIAAKIEVIAPKDINAAYERVLKGNVHYRFVIDMKAL